MEEGGAKGKSKLNNKQVRLEKPKDRSKPEAVLSKKCGRRQS